MDNEHKIESPVDDQDCGKGCECFIGADQFLTVKNLAARDIRSLIFHLLYAMDAHEYDTPLQSVVDNINRGFNLDLPFDHKVVTIVRDIVQHREELDASYIPFLKNWRIERVGICTRLVLRYAMWELLYTDTDTRIIINEAIELSKCFAEEDAHRFINGILDRAAKALRKEKAE